MAEAAPLTLSSIATPFGFFNGIISFILMIENQIPDKDHKGENSAVRIQVALNGPSPDGTGILSGADGHSPVIIAYNEIGDPIGHTNWHKQSQIADGSFEDFVVIQDLGVGQQATWLQITGWDDAICIADIAQTWADGTKRAWLGDYGAFCDMNWYYSNIIVGDNGHKPNCTWLDADHTNGLRTAALQIHMEDFSAKSKKANAMQGIAGEERCITKDEQYSWCTYPTLVFESSNHDLTPAWSHSGMFELWNGSNAAHNFTLNPLVRRGGLSHGFRKLVTSSSDRHSAHAICASPTSWGPDFVHLDEQTFCDMDTRITYPLCGESVRDECYDFEYHHLVARAERRPRDYHHMDSWHLNGSHTRIPYPGQKLRARMAPRGISGGMRTGGVDCLVGWVMVAWLLVFLFRRSR